MTPPAPVPLVVRDRRLATRVLEDIHVRAYQSAGAPPPVPAEAVPTLGQYHALWYSLGPDHATTSHALRRALSPRAVAVRTALADDAVAPLVDALPPSGDLVATYLTPAAESAVLAVLGVPAPERSRTARVAGFLAATLGAATPPPPPAVETALRYLRGLTDLLLDNPAQVPFAEALHDLRRAGLTAWQLAAVVGQVVTAGRDPMVSLCASTCLEVAGAPVAPDVGGPPGGRVLDAAVERALHHEPPFRHLHRVVTENCRCAEPVLGGGSTISIDVAAAQQDSTAGGALLAFGHGAHYCLGAALARQVVPVVVGELFTRRAGLLVDRAGARRREGSALRTVIRIPYSSVPSRHPTSRWGAGPTRW